MMLPFLEVNYNSRHSDLKKRMIDMKKIIFNIGRQFGSGGRIVAEKLGQKLGIPVYDSKLISRAAEESGFSPYLFRKTDETKSKFSLRSFFCSQDFGQPENYVNSEELFKIQSAVIRNIAEKESAIIIGRCSDYILRDLDCTVDVFVCSPKEKRKATVSKRLGVSEEKAEEIMSKKDRSRETYYNFFTFGNWGVASNYDLCIDSSALGIEGTADFIIEFARRAGKLD